MPPRTEIVRPGPSHRTERGIMEAIEKMCGKQSEVDSVSDLRLKIHLARSVRELNALRTAVVACEQADILKDWQDKYWHYKNG